MRKPLFASALVPAPVALVALAAFGALGCAADFEPASTLNSLRVLAVQKDKPYARPGETVTLRMLLDDPPPTGPRPIEVIWLGGFCANPPGDSYLGCASLLVPKPGEPYPLGPLGLSSKIVEGTGPVFSLRIPKDIVSSRPPPVNRKQPPFGVEFVFFTACAGHLGAAPAGEFDPVNNPGSLPFACYSPKGERLDQSSFVAGYTELFASNIITNQNPIVTGFEVDDQGVTPSCTGVACVPGKPDIVSGNGANGAGTSLDAGLGLHGGDAGLTHGGALVDGGPLDAALADAGVGIDAGVPLVDGGAPPEIDPCHPPSGKQPTAACIDVCTTDKQDDCPKHTIKLLVDPSSDEIDQAEKAIEGTDVYEQEWINYYTDGGKIPVEVKLLGDATSGYQEKHETKLLAPKKKGIFHVWAVAHDNRGGSQWARVVLSAR